jgi:hypothetical protein
MRWPLVLLLMITFWKHFFEFPNSRLRRGLKSLLLVTGLPSPWSEVLNKRVLAIRGPRGSWVISEVLNDSRIDILILNENILVLIMGVKAIMLSPSSYYIGFLFILLLLASLVYLMLTMLRELPPILLLALWWHTFCERWNHCGIIKFGFNQISCHTIFGYFWHILHT